MADEKNEAPEAFQKFLRASQACLPASNVARGHPRCVQRFCGQRRAGRTEVSGLWVGPLERGAVTGVHESDTLLCATKTCSHVCAASAPASVWFSCFTAHRKNVWWPENWPTKNRGVRSFPKVSKGHHRPVCPPRTSPGPPTLRPPLPPSKTTAGPAGGGVRSLLEHSCRNS